MSFREAWEYEKDRIIGNTILFAVLAAGLVVGAGYLLHVGWSLYG